jgi:hypothetical protein
MPRKIILSSIVFLAVAAAVFGIGAAAAPAQVALPQAITASTPCPVAGCTQPDGACHAAAAPPEADGSFSMTCPKNTGCSDTVCHAQDRLVSHYNRPSDMSLNLWILAPVALAVGMVLLARKI